METKKSNITYSDQLLLNSYGLFKQDVILSKEDGRAYVFDRGVDNKSFICHPLGVKGLSIKKEYIEFKQPHSLFIPILVRVKKNSMSMFNYEEQTAYKNNEDSNPALEIKNDYY